MAAATWGRPNEAGRPPGPTVGPVSTELKNLGHGVANITRAFNDLKARRPALAIQVQKSGRAKQARKKYKITEAGLTKVRKMLLGQGSGEEEEGS